MATATTGKCVAYYRVSTQRQGWSGLEFKAQRAAVRNHLNGGDWKIVAEFTELESRQCKDNPRLAEALAACRVHGAKLIIAKLDRLARNVAFLSAVMNAGVEFEAVDFPQANPLTIHVLAALAKHESKLTSERTKAALAAAKRRGVKLGGFRAGAKLTATARQAGVKANQERAEARAADLAPIIRELRATRITSLRRIADALNRRGIRTPRGKQWLAGSVSQLLARL